MDVQVVFDAACPWCFIGKRRLERALEERPEIRPHRSWRPFLLNPDMPRQGMDRRVYVERKFGGPQRARRMLEAAESAGRMVGINFRFDLIRRTPNTIDAHRLVRLSRDPVQQDTLIEALFQAYFMEGRDIGDVDVLADVGADQGMDPARVRDHLATEMDVQAIHAENSRAHAMGMTGVPGFVFNGMYAIAGAQEPAIFLRMVDLALETQVAVPVTNGV